MPGKRCVLVTLIDVLMEIRPSRITSTSRLMRPIPRISTSVASPGRQPDGGTPRRVRPMRGLRPPGLVPGFHGGYHRLAPSLVWWILLSPSQYMRFSGRFPLAPA